MLKPQGASIPVSTLDYLKLTWGRIVLPVSALLDQYKAADNALLKLYDSVFIQHSLGRLEQHERRDLIPRAIKGIGSDTSPSRDSLFNAILRLLPDLKL